MKLPSLVSKHRRYFFPFFGAPCCEKMSRWLSIEAFHGLWPLALAHNATQADLLIIVGRVSHKQAPVLQHLYYQTLSPSYVLHLKGCTTYLIDYASLRSLDKLLPMNCTLESCPISYQQVEKAILELGSESKSS